MQYPTLTIFLILEVLSVFISQIHAIKCHCKGIDCYTEEQTCEGTYCYTVWIVAGGSISDKGCLSTRADLSQQKCEKDRKGQVFCLCDSDYCNADGATIPSDVTIETHKILKCSDSQSATEDEYCFGSSCTYSAAGNRNEFDDVFWDEVTKGCSDDFAIASMNTHGNCQITNEWMYCTCQEDFCNSKQPYPVSIGKVMCYRYDPTKMEKTKYCMGDLCYRDVGKDLRGCVSTSTGNEVIRRDGYESTKDLKTMYCSVDLCNGDHVDSSSNRHNWWLTIGIGFVTLQMLRI